MSCFNMVALTLCERVIAIAALYAMETKSTPEEWSSCQLQPEKNLIYGKGGGFLGRGTLRAGCSADTRWSVPLVKRAGG